MRLYAQRLMQCSWLVLLCNCGDVAKPPDAALDTGRAAHEDMLRDADAASKAEIGAETYAEIDAEVGARDEAWEAEAADGIDGVDGIDGIDNVDAMSNRAPHSASCELAGPWLFELEVPVRWEANAQIKAGSGNVRLRATSLRKAAGNLLIDGLTPCALALPPTVRKSGAQVRTKIPQKAFAEGAQTIAPAITSIRSNKPGARYRMQPVALQYGAVIPNATMATWPEDITFNAVDVDGDGYPGVTMHVSTSQQSLIRDPVTDLFVAWRLVLRTAGGRLKTCDTLDGLGSVPSIAQQLAVNVSVMGCNKRSGAACSAAESEMAAAWLPSYLRDGNAKLRITRRAEDTRGVCEAF